ncbi:MAG: phosphoribosylanthranilate isomerase [Candidatus Omnitrophica bacterium]|nr:phosphoribosylanthranilate isomerase [Candidatus Omnitrophota bacterium]MDE2231293.1 phosphoribosylanthranilate isomerase [Candidatus Omnitrophota bacterium]
MVRVKICGITNELDAQRAARAGAWAVGFIFYKKSPRFISPFKARKIIDTLPPFITPVGVFVNHKSGAIRDIISHCGLRAVQLHGEEDHHFCHRLKSQNLKVIKVFRVGGNFDLRTLDAFKVDAFMFDTYDGDNYGGTGKTFDWEVLKQVKASHDVPVILSGGLNAQNVIEPVNVLKPYAVDVNSGVEESPGKKDHRKMKDFIDIVTYISGAKVKDHANDH